MEVVMIRIWLGPDDIARTRIAPAPLPLHEILVSLATAPVVDDPELVRLLRDLRLGAGPASPVRDASGPGGGVDAGVRPANLLAPLPEDPSLEGALEWLVTNSTYRVRSLAAAVRAYYERGVADELAAWESVVRLDVAERSRSLATGGVEALLGLLDPLAAWRNPVLAVASPVDLDLRPDGTGLVLVPSVFARHLWVGNQPDPAVVVFPVRRPRAVGSHPARSHSMDGRSVGGRPDDPRRVRPPVPAYAPATADPLIALLGRSRAAVLRAALVGANTTDLARRAGISTPSASQHASVLRDAGLLRTTRHGRAAHHTLTPLARALLTAYETATRR
ncbi:ArsR/SmtB family transcription factor [Plantactinospora sonchi]|uniref:Winged helix-turn-helix domain-containing protein n=1 Tax=Plantactinospora sonchi TaxID=1544735 RepID=A0ABU7RKB6_9ACTN